MHELKSYVLLFVIAFYKYIECYPHGAPDKCDTYSLTRTYPLSNQGNNDPYILLQTAVSYKPGQVINGNVFCLFLNIYKH